METVFENLGFDYILKSKLCPKSRIELGGERLDLFYDSDYFPPVGSYLLSCKNFNFQKLEDIFYDSKIQYKQLLIKFSNDDQSVPTGAIDKKLFALERMYHHFGAFKNLRPTIEESLFKSLVWYSIHNDLEYVLTHLKEDSEAVFRLRSNLVNLSALADENSELTTMIYHSKTLNEIAKLNPFFKEFKIEDLIRKKNLVMPGMGSLLFAHCRQNR